MTNSPLPERTRPRTWKLLRRHCQIRVQDHQEVAARNFKGGKDGIGLSRARLPQRFDVELRVGGDHPLDFVPSAILRVSFNEDDLKIVRKAR